MIPGRPFPRSRSNQPGVMPIEDLPGAGEASYEASNTDGIAGRHETERKMSVTEMIRLRRHGEVERQGKFE